MGESGEKDEATALDDTKPAVKTKKAKGAAASKPKKSGCKDQSRSGRKRANFRNLR